MVKRVFMKFWCNSKDRKEKGKGMIVENLQPNKRRKDWSDEDAKCSHMVLKARRDGLLKKG